MPTEARLPAGPAYGILKGWTGKLILRPWFDAVAVRGVANWILRLSRAWASGIEAAGDGDRFAAQARLEPSAIKKTAPALTRLHVAHCHYDDIEARWQDAFFGGTTASVSSLVGLETERFHAATRFMATRRLFFPVRRHFPMVDWSIAGPGEVNAAHGSRLGDPAKAFPAPNVPVIEMSPLVPGVCRRESWLRMPAPSRTTGDTARAHVYWPEGKVRGAVVSLHGILMDQEMWPLVDPVTQMTENGFCVIRPEGPWHGRRRRPGTYGGEPVLSTGLLGFLNLFEAWVAEVALWIHWARAETGGPVGLAGISLGALTSQLVTARCGSWPTDMRPDGVLLITTTGDNVGGTLQGSLATLLGIHERLRGAGWRDKDIAHWRPLVEPGETPAVDPNAIVMTLGDVDTITPFPGGAALADTWRIPPANLFVSHGGHFSAALGLYGNRAPLDRFATILTG